MTKDIVRSYGYLTLGSRFKRIGERMQADVQKLEERGLVKPHRSDKDQRVKRVGLTAQGRKVVDHAKREIWPLVEHAVAEICEGLDGPLLEQLGAIEEALTSKPLYRRAGGDSSDAESA